MPGRLSNKHADWNPSPCEDLFFALIFYICSLVQKISPYVLFSVKSSARCRREFTDNAIAYKTSIINDNIQFVLAVWYMFILWFFIYLTVIV